MAAIAAACAAEPATLPSGSQGPAAGEAVPAEAYRRVVLPVDAGAGPWDGANAVAAQPGPLTAGDLVWVLDTVTEGSVDWHLVALDASRTELDLPFGWIPATADGRPTLGVAAIRCPAHRLMVPEVAALGRFGGLACFGSAPIELVGFTPLGCGAGGSARIGTPDWLNGTWSGVGIGDGEPLPPDFSVEFSVTGRVAPGAPVPPACGDPGWARFTAHFDHPDAGTCRTEDFDGMRQVILDPKLSRLLCRAQLVLTGVTRLAGPP